MGAHLTLEDLKDFEDSINPVHFRKILISLTIIFMFGFLKLNNYICDDILKICEENKSIIDSL
mgnify:CR=1 FL=1